MSVSVRGRPTKHRRVEHEPGTHRTTGVNPRSFAVGRPSRPNPSANPVGGHGRRSLPSVTLHTRRPPRSRHKPGRLILTTLTGIVGGVVLAFGMTGQAQAAPTPAEIEAQIDQMWNQIEPVIEQYNAADAELQANTAKAKQLETQIRPLALQVDVAFSRVSSIAAQYYMTGRTSTFSALL